MIGINLSAKKSVNTVNRQRFWDIEDLMQLIQSRINESSELNSNLIKRRFKSAQKADNWKC